jgi:hypothetical protein
MYSNWGAIEAILIVVAFEAREASEECKQVMHLMLAGTQASRAQAVISWRRSIDKHGARQDFAHQK